MNLIWRLPHSLCNIVIVIICEYIILTELLVRVSFYSKYFIYIDSFNSYMNLIRQVLLFLSFYCYGKWGMRVTYPVSHN